MRGLKLAAMGALAINASVSVAMANDADWSGFSAGIHAGHLWGKAEAENGAPTLKPSGMIVGIGAGFDHQFQNGLVLGALADFTVGSVADAVQDGSPYLMLSSKLESMGTLRGRVGYAYGQFLPYVTGGLAWTKGTGGIECFPGAPQSSMCFNFPAGVAETDTVTKAGWTLGVGAEYAISRHWAAKVEYLHADFGTVEFDMGIFGPGRSRLTADSLKLGVNYRF
jgi:outer membrane immunogenic protein